MIWGREHRTESRIDCERPMAPRYTPPTRPEFLSPDLRIQALELVSRGKPVTADMIPIALQVLWFVTASRPSDNEPHPFEVEAKVAREAMFPETVAKAVTPGSGKGQG